MSENQKKHTKEMARAVKRILVSVITLLGGCIVVLVFRVGENLWPAWMIAYRLRIMGIASLALVFVIFLTPVIMEVTRRTRTLSGPGKNPYIDPWS